MVSVVADRRLDAAAAVAGEIERAGGRAIAMEVDVANRASVVALADRVDADLGGASVLVNNAGVLGYSPLDEAEEQGWRWIVDVNLFGVVYGLQTFLPRMIAGGHEAHVVNTASLAGIIGAMGVTGNRLRAGDGAPASTPIAAYTATKYAVVGISESLARDLAGSRIGVSVLCPSHHEDTAIYENSARFRPPEFGGPMAAGEVEQAFGRITEQRREAYGRAPTQHRFADECAARVVHAIRTRQFYVMTHPETRAAVEHRGAELLAAYDDARAFDG
jgi:NAD(P)-dependent dehydrogenase (short-subunit alcohol dehydrogenase family)